MHQDTVVGIVGAIVLVSVMVGVFVYEYNSVEEPGEAMGFSEKYPTLNAMDDIDGDGTPNAEDDDLDGDGTPNAEDNATEVHQTGSGNLGPSAGVNTNSVGYDFVVGNGTTGGMAEAIVTPTAATPGGFTILLTFPDGTVESREASGASFTFDADAMPGVYTLRVSTSGVSPGGSVAFESHITY